MKKKNLFKIEEKLKVLQSLTNEESGRLLGGVADPPPPSTPTPAPVVTFSYALPPPPPPVTVSYNPNIGSIGGPVNF